MIIRKATSWDGPAIQQLLEQLGYPDVTLEDTKRNLNQHRGEDYQVLVGEIEGHVMAFIALHCFHLMHWKEKMGRISSFCVEDGFRSKGAGRQMLHAAEEWFRVNGCAKIEVTSNARRIRAHQFYLNLGYIEDSRRFVKYLKPQNK
jgi:N-acetylglutamate synthase-like GNAT family acetyltransferase